MRRLRGSTSVFCFYVHVMDAAPSSSMVCFSDDTFDAVIFNASHSLSTTMISKSER